MNEKPPITFVNDDASFENEPIFTFDKFLGFVLNALAGLGMFSLAIAIAFFAGYLS